MNSLDMSSKLRGLSIQTIRKLDELCTANYALHMVDDYEMLVSAKDREILDLRQVRRLN